MKEVDLLDAILFVVIEKIVTINKLVALKNLINFGRRGDRKVEN